MRNAASILELAAVLGDGGSRGGAAFAVAGPEQGVPRRHGRQQGAQREAALQEGLEVGVSRPRSETRRVICQWLLSLLRYLLDLYTLTFDEDETVDEIKVPTRARDKIRGPHLGAKCEDGNNGDISGSKAN